MIKTWPLGYKEARRRAKKIYSKIGRIQCPCLDNEYISFNRDGFDHLVYKGRISRTKNEQKKRFVLIEYAEQIIKQSTSYSYEEREMERKILNKYRQRILVKSKARFWTFSLSIKGCEVKLVVIQIGEGFKRFCSIMGDKVKISRGKTKTP
ncbi:MAG: hypothetical protein V1686_01755 [Patescibacteria group bacterium]